MSVRSTLSHPPDSRDALRARLEDRWRAHVVELVELSIRLYDEPGQRAGDHARLASVRAALARIEAALNRLDHPAPAPAGVVP